MDHNYRHRHELMRTMRLLTEEYESLRKVQQDFTSNMASIMSRQVEIHRENWIRVTHEKSNELKLKIEKIQKECEESEMGIEAAARSIDFDQLHVDMMNEQNEALRVAMLKSREELDEKLNSITNVQECSMKQLELIMNKIIMVKKKLIYCFIDLA
jgi:hypothetical protein